jgi:predicted nucleic acid-binding protein
MNNILIDTSVWIEYFSGNKAVNDLDNLIDEGIICTNDIILCELIPFLKGKKEFELIDLLKSINNIQLEINWNKLIDYQFENVKRNIKKIGIPDLIILENIIDNDLEIYTFDKHFIQMKEIFKIKMYKDIK